MSVHLYIKDNTTGVVHEYGENCHDSLILMEDGSLHYLNLQNSCGTMFPDEGYSFVRKDGSSPLVDAAENPDCDSFLDIGGDYYETETERSDTMTFGEELYDTVRTRAVSMAEDIVRTHRESFLLAANGGALYAVIDNQIKGDVVPSEYFLNLFWEKLSEYGLYSGESGKNIRFGDKVAITWVPIECPSSDKRG